MCFLCCRLAKNSKLTRALWHEERLCLTTALPFWAEARKLALELVKGPKRP